MTWYALARIVESEYGGYVDWDECFFLCPECGEPIYKEDYPFIDDECCPVCEFEF